MRAYCHRIKKHYGRLYIERLETGELIYTPPDFLRRFIHNRDAMHEACDKLDAGEHYADVIMAFETRIRPCSPTGSRQQTQNL